MRQVRRHLQMMTYIVAVLLVIFVVMDDHLVIFKASVKVMNMGKVQVYLGQYVMQLAILYGVLDNGLTRTIPLPTNVLTVITLIIMRTVRLQQQLILVCIMVKDMKRSHHFIPHPNRQITITLRIIIIQMEKQVAVK